MELRPHQPAGDGVKDKAQPIGDRTLKGDAIGGHLDLVYHHEVFSVLPLASDYLS